MTPSRTRLKHFASKKSLRMAATIVLAVMSATTLAPIANAFQGFAQSSQTVTMAPPEAHRLAGYFTPPFHPGPMPSVVSDILLRSASAELHDACAAMVDSWGGAARGSARVTMKILGVTAGNAWIAYRCDSRVPRFANDYSERLASFSASRGTIQFIDLVTPTDNAATFYHVSLASMVKLAGAENSAAFEVFAFNTNPLDTDANHAAQNRTSENRFVVIANSPTTTKIALTLVTAREQPDRKNHRAGVEGLAANGEDYRAAIHFDHDLRGHLTAVNAYHHDRPSGARSSYGTSRYEWDEASLTFASAVPFAIPKGRGKRLPPVPGFQPSLAN
jgi:hypothetical protein